MARNEEKQLARLNRFYLQKQREEDLKKRPPRPKLETLTTPEELRKWMPSITRDIEFYVKQMEVPCYRDEQIEEFSQRVNRLRGEYKAYLRKLRELDPENKVITPWSDRPYEIKKGKVSSSGSTDSKDEERSHTGPKEDSSDKRSPAKLIPLHTPVLENDQQNTLNFGYAKPVIVKCPHLSDDEESMNQPLQLAPIVSFITPNSGNKTTGNNVVTNHSQPVDDSIGKVKSSNQCLASNIHNNDIDRVVPCESSGILNLPYSDSSSSGDET